jgi:CheY-like chemotaxis protein
VAKILVADDNSNIQKMVVLALKDQGIEVVAVGNGEAAVRKISDVKPDLVLADIFMPVRNGYEVCKFVKDASSLSHIPVILLVGAFDPLDEQEAQRVGADGVLKKPFVPPDPLISMVKSALARAGVVLGGSAPPPAPTPAPVVTGTEPPPLPRAVPPPVPFVVESETDLGLPSFGAPQPAPLTIDKSAQPLAFGSLLDSPASESVPYDDAVFSLPSSRVAPERDWGSSSAAEEVEETEEASKNGWRTSSLQESVDEVPAGQTDWREAAFSGIGAEKTHAAGWAPSVEKNSLSITEEEAAALARERDAAAAAGTSRGPEDWAKAIGEVFPDKPKVETDYHAPVMQELPSVPPPPIPEQVLVAAPEPPKPVNGPAADSWMAGAVSPWDSELPHASQLASSWDSAKISAAAMVQESSATEALLDSGLMSSAQTSHVEQAGVEEPVAEALVAEVPENEVQAEEPPVSEPSAEAASAIDSLLSPATQEILQEETAQVIAEEQAAPPDDSAEAPRTPSAEVAPVAAPNMDEIVAKVLARMNPEVLQAVTREILKPLVQEMIKDELQKK